MTRKKYIVLVALCATVLIARVSISAETPQYLSLIEQGDSLYLARTETTGSREALAVYEKAMALELANVSALWKAARACYWLAEHAALKPEAARKERSRI